MIEAIEAYIENIVGLMIVTALAEMIMPESGFKKYARLITGLIIVVAVTEPAAELIYGKGFEFELKEAYLSENGDDQREIANEIYIGQLKNNCRIIAEQNGVEIRDINIKDEGKRIDSIQVYMKPLDSCVDYKEEYCNVCGEKAEVLKGEIMASAGVRDVEVIIHKE